MHHLAKSVVCPFYVNAKEFSVKCEGYKDGTTLRICFDCKEIMAAHTKRYCNNINGYDRCPLYPVIMKQYKSKEERDE